MPGYSIYADVRWPVRQAAIGYTTHIAQGRGEGPHGFVAAQGVVLGS